MLSKIRETIRLSKINLDAEFDKPEYDINRGAFIGDETGVARRSFAQGIHARRLALIDAKYDAQTRVFGAKLLALTFAVIAFVSALIGHHEHRLSHAPCSEFANEAAVPGRCLPGWGK